MQILNKKEYQNTWVGEISPIFNDSKENRISISHLANVCQGGLESKNPQLRYEQLLTECVGKPSTPLEFIPVILNCRELLNNEDSITGIEFVNNIVRRSYITQKYLYTNFRAVYNHYNNIDIIPFNNNNDEYSKYKIIVGRLPYFILMHLRTHRTFSFMIETARKKDKEKDYYITDDIHYKDKSNMLELRMFAMGAWSNDNDTWKHLFEVRNSNSTQKDTKLIVNLMQEILCL